MNLQLLEKRSELQQLEISTVVLDRLRRASSRLESINTQLSPLRLASKVGDAKARLAVFRQRADSAVVNSIDGKLKSLKICAATLDALSPLAVLGRGFAIAQTEKGRI